MNATFATFESAGGAQVWRIPLQAFPGFWAYAYVVRVSGKVYLLDTGSGTDSSHEDLLNGLTHAGLSPSALTHILLTHAHIDHYGGLAKLVSLTDAKIGCHELDVQTVSHHEARVAFITHRLASFLASSGLAKPEQDQLLGIYKSTKGLYHSVPVDFTYEAREMQIGPFELTHLPGHCPGHVALRLDDIVFCGDMVVDGVTPHIAPESIQPYSGLDHYLESLHRFQLWSGGARLILNGHDEAITDLPAQVDATRRNILRRMSKAINALSEPLSIAEVCNVVYENPSGYNLLLTIEKMGAYLESLYEHAMIGISNPDDVEQGLPAKYRKLREISDEEILPRQRNTVVE